MLEKSLQKLEILPLHNFALKGVEERVASGAEVEVDAPKVAVEVAHSEA